MREDYFYLTRNILAVKVTDLLAHFIDPLSTYLILHHFMAFCHIVPL